jgi:hypothetical protein
MWVLVSGEDCVNYRSFFNQINKPNIDHPSPIVKHSFTDFYSTYVVLVQICSVFLLFDTAANKLNMQLLVYHVEINKDRNEFLG